MGDEVKAFLLLDGNGAELKTFKLQNDDEVDTKLFYEQTEVSTEGNRQMWKKDSFVLRMGCQKPKLW